MLRALAAALCGTALLAAPAALAQACPAGAGVPGAEWPTAPVDPVAKATAIKNLEDYLFTLQGTDAERKGLRTDGLVIIKNGKLVYEKYARGFDATKPHLSWSVAKSVSSVLVGVAQKLGALSISDSVCKHLQGYSGPVCDISVKDFITFGSGLRWQEGYEFESYQTSSVISMFFGVGHRDQIRHVLTHDTQVPPGTRWRYSTGDAEVAGTVARRALEGRYGKDAFWTQFFDKLGLTSAVFEEDVKGAVLGGSHFYATPRDYARIGYFMLNDGCWNGERLVPAGWVLASTTPSEVYVNGGRVDSENSAIDNPSGYSWWLNKPTPALPAANGLPARPAAEKPWTLAPDDAYGANGHWGQFIWVVPSEDLVVVRTGDDRTGRIDQGKAISLAMEVAR